MLKDKLTKVKEAEHFLYYVKNDMITSIKKGYPVLAKIIEQSTQLPEASTWREKIALSASRIVYGSEVLKAREYFLGQLEQMPANEKAIIYKYAQRSFSENQDESASLELDGICKAFLGRRECFNAKFARDIMEITKGKH